MRPPQRERRRRSLGDGFGVPGELYGFRGNRRRAGKIGTRVKR
jgi:hypothetical protein